MLSVSRYSGPGGHDRNTAPEYFGLMGVAHGPLRKAPQRERLCRSRATARRSFVLRCVSVVVPVHAQLDGESASCSPGHRAMCWSFLGARAAAAQHRNLSVNPVACVQSAFVRRLDDTAVIA